MLAKMTPVAMNPLRDAQSNIGWATDFLVQVAGSDIPAGDKATARDVLIRAAEINPELSMLAVVEAFELVPSLHGFAARLRKAALPGDFGKYFDPVPTADVTSPEGQP